MASGDIESRTQRLNLKIQAVKTGEVSIVANENLSSAKRAKNDEFYTQYHDIELEINAYLEYNPDVFKGKTVLLPCDDPEWSNFTKYFAQKFEALGLKKLISTSYAANSKSPEIPYQPTLFELEDGKFDDAKTYAHGKIFTLTNDMTGDGVINVQDLEWTYLEGDGDFRSDEVVKLRDGADLIVTNPPFSLFKKFLAWIVEADKQFLIIGNKNAITYKEVFPLIKENKMWLGGTPMSKDLLFGLPRPMADELVATKKEGSAWKRVDGIVLGRASGVWFSNIDHGRRHQPLALMSESDNRKFSKDQGLREHGYQKYDNYNAIEVGRTESIPGDYPGVMGVPISFLSRYNPDQFEILGASDNGAVPEDLKLPHFKKHNEPFIGGNKLYKRIFIRYKKIWK